MLMQYFQDVLLQERLEQDVPLHFLWRTVYQQLHLALAEMQDDKGQVGVGVAFPDYGSSQLGATLRLLATNSDQLNDLNLKQWFARLNGYTLIKPAQVINPKLVNGYGVFMRDQVKQKGSVEKNARRRAKRCGISYEEALQYFQGYEKPFVQATPFVWMQSLSSGHNYQLRITRTMSTEPAKSPRFNTFGLGVSSCAAVPLF